MDVQKSFAALRRVQDFIRELNQVEEILKVVMQAERLEREARERLADLERREDNLKQLLESQTKRSEELASVIVEQEQKLQQLNDDVKRRLETALSYAKADFRAEMMKLEKQHREELERLAVEKQSALDELAKMDEEIAARKRHLEELEAKLDEWLNRIVGR